MAKIGNNFLITCKVCGRGDPASQPAEAEMMQVVYSDSLGRHRNYKKPYKPDIFGVPFSKYQWCRGGFIREWS